MKIMVIGNARHGKDSVCEVLSKDFGLSFVSSSQFVAERAVKPWLAERGITYDSFEAMYADRVNHRAAWFDAISAFNGEDPARLARELLEVHDIYCGMRCAKELAAVKAQGLVDFTFWVDASGRLPPEPASSMTVTKDMADWVIDNNGTADVLRGEVIDAMAAAMASRIPHQP